MSKMAFLFPGQGSQFVGMGQNIYTENPLAKAFFDQANDALDFDLPDLAFNGPMEKLSQTNYTQPALVAVEIMLLTALMEAGIKPDVVAGLSLGEYTALVAAGALDALDAVKLVSKRGDIMASALPVGLTAMAAVLGMESDLLATLCRENSRQSVVEIANYNCPGQLVIGGHKDAVATVSELALTQGARRVIPLEVSGAFHTSLLKDASEKLRVELEKISFNPLEMPVLFNKSADFQTEPLIDLLTAQVYSPVRFQETIEHMIKIGVDTFIEVGPGKTLSGFIKKVDRKLTVYQVENAADIKQLQTLLGGEENE